NINCDAMMFSVMNGTRSAGDAVTRRRSVQYRCLTLVLAIGSAFVAAGCAGGSMAPGGTAGSGGSATQTGSAGTSGAAGGDAGGPRSGGPRAPGRGGGANTGTVRRR